MRILIVEDEKPIGQHVKRNLESAGFVCDHILKVVGDEEIKTRKLHLVLFLINKYFEN